MEFSEEHWVSWADLYFDGCFHSSEKLFLYLSVYVLNPLKNKIVNNLRLELYEKILHLPIGYFTEKRKGDLISRMTNDVDEVEGSVVGTLEGWISDPLTIIFNFGFILYQPAAYLFHLFFHSCFWFCYWTDQAFIEKAIDRRSHETGRSSFGA